ncbi:MAG: peptidase domain protein [Bacteroidetes bacterium]|jgi:predicted metalloprotease with PDZ domain|nr:peptidase domain protein [Bacteroidota bacterium]
MKYIVSYTKPHNHFVDIEFIADSINSDKILLQLPAWRPGRYELGNFAKNIQKFGVFDENGKALIFQKKTKDSWEILTKGVTKIHVKYNYYAVDLNAGSTFLDATQLYMNPVNCCVFIPERINEKCEMEIVIPKEYRIAIGAQYAPLSSGKGIEIRFKDFHELADSPFIASASLQHNKFVCEGVEFNFWFQGECRPDWDKLNKDFVKFCEHQLKMMKKAPFAAYHFLFQILPQKMYHGVEHVTSTVIALGPGYNLMKGDLYENLLGVSCHELFHAWNIKTIRPVEMQPYDYTKENYSKLGYVCEGVTTYYGDYLLFRSGVFNEEQYFGTFNERLQKHFDNAGRFNMSVADSSFDTWLDGYTPGIPNRKTNIYDEGNLLAFITDMFIRKNTKNKYSLDDVMRHLNEEFALKGKGYSDQDYKGLVEHYANSSFDEIFTNYFNGIRDYEPLLIEAMDYVGCELVKQNPAKYHEHALGIKVSEVGGICKVAAVYPDSVADKAGMSIGDDIVVINNIQVKADNSGTNFSEWCNYFSGKKLDLTITSNLITKQLSIDPQPGQFYKTIKIKKQDQPAEDQIKNFELWSNNNFK